MSTPDDFGDFDLDFLVVQLAFTQALAEQLAGVGVRGWRGVFVETHARRWQQGVEDALFGGVFGAVADLGHFLFAQQLQGGVGQVTDDRLDVAAHVADFGELGRFDLDERGIGQLGQAPGDFGFADAGRADHQDVLGRYFNAQFFRQLHPAPAVTQGDGNGALGIVLADDMAIEFMDDFAGSHGHNVWRSSSGNKPTAYSARSCSSMVKLWLVNTQISPAIPRAVSTISRADRSVFFNSALAAAWA